MPPMTQSIKTLPEYPISSPVFSGVLVSLFNIFWQCFVDHSLFYLSFLFWISFQFTTSDFHFGIFNIFCCFLRYLFFINSGVYELFSLHCRTKCFTRCYPIKWLWQVGDEFTFSCAINAYHYSVRLHFLLVIQSSLSIKLTSTI
jgi:hypothetical protein